MKYITTICILLFALQVLAQPKKIVALYVAGNYQECIIKCDDLIKQKTDDNLVYLYKAMSISQLIDDEIYLKKNKNAVEQSLDILLQLKRKKLSDDFYLTYAEKFNIVKNNSFTFCQTQITKKDYARASKIYNLMGKVFSDIQVVVGAAFTDILINKPHADSIFILKVKQLNYNDSQTKMLFNEAYFNNVSTILIAEKKYTASLNILLEVLPVFNCSEDIKLCVINSLNTEKIPPELVLNYFDLFNAACPDERLFNQKWQALDTLFEQNKQLLNETITKPIFTKIFTGQIHFNTDINYLYKLLSDKMLENQMHVEFLSEMLINAYSQHFNLDINHPTFESEFKKHFSDFGITISTEIEKQCATSVSAYKLLLSEINNQLKSNNYSGAMEKWYIITDKYGVSDALLQLQKQIISSDYKLNYLKTSINYTELGWTGNFDKCIAGKISLSAQQKMLKRLMYIRRLAGVPDKCEFVELLNAKCQQAALIMGANYKLTHYPDSKLSCFTQDGATAAGSSNLSLGHHSTAALMGQVEDYGENNYAVGHRRWILNPATKYFGHGSNTQSMALWVFNADKGFHDPKIVDIYRYRFVSWPAKGYFPADFMFSRWSFSIMGADFSKAKVEMFYNDNEIKLTIQKYETGYGQNTLVWEPELQVLPGTVYTVKISNYFTNITNIPLQTIYFVIPVKIEKE